MKDVIENALLAGRQKEEIQPYRIIEDLGFSCRFTNDKKNIVLKIACGSCFERSANDVSFSLDVRELPTLRAQSFVSLLREMLQLWDADFGVLCLQDSQFASNKEILVRYAKSSHATHEGYPPTGRQIGQWKGGRVWTTDEFSQYLSDWDLGPPKPLSILEKSKFLMTYGKLPS